MTFDTIPLNAELVRRNHSHTYTSPGTEQGPLGSPLSSSCVSVFMFIDGQQFILAHYGVVPNQLLSHHII